MQHRPVGQDDEFLRPVRIDDHRAVGLLVIPDRLSGRLDHFQRPDDTLAVSRPQSLCHFGIASRQFRVENRRPFFNQPAAQPVADFVRDDRHVRQSPGQRLEIKPRAADDDGKTRLPTQIRKQDGNIPQPFTRGIEAACRHMAVKQMRHALHFFF